MKQSVMRSLGEKDGSLLLETTPKKLAALDEDELIDLHRRVRRARNKHVTKYRRKAAKRVAKSGGRGTAGAGNRRSRERAEAVEVALARVSRRLAAAAADSAAELRRERLAAARGPATKGRPAPRRRTPSAPTRRRDDRRARTPDRRKRAAGSAASGARRQTRLDSR